MKVFILNRNCLTYGMQCVLDISSDVEVKSYVYLEQAEWILQIVAGPSDSIWPSVVYLPLREHVRQKRPVVSPRVLSQNLIPVWDYV